MKRKIFAILVLLLPVPAADSQSLITGAAWEPWRSADVHAWYKPYTAAAASWPDAINGYDATAAGSAQPTVTGGIPDFDGSDDEYDLGSGTFGTLTQPNTIGIVFKSDDTTSSTLAIFDSDDTGARNAIHVPHSGTVQASMLSATSNDPLGGTPNTSWRYLVAIFNTASSELRIDGSSVDTGNPGSQSMAGITIGGYGGAGFNFNGKIATVVVFDAALSGDDLTLLESYLERIRDAQ